MGKPNLMIGTQWENFRDQVLSKDLPPETVIAMKVAFYSGVQAYINIEDQATELTQDEDVLAEIVETLSQELEEFWTGVQK